MSDNKPTLDELMSADPLGLVNDAPRRRAIISNIREHRAATLARLAQGKSAPRRKRAKKEKGPELDNTTTGANND